MSRIKPISAMSCPSVSAFATIASSRQHRFASVAPIGTVTQMFELPLEEEQMTEGQRLILAGRRHVPGCAQRAYRLEHVSC